MTRPPEVRALMLRYPPSCVVRAVRPLYCPAPDEIAIVSGYSPSGDRVSVIAAPTQPRRIWCRESWLEVVDYWNGVTPDFLSALFGGRITNVEGQTISTPDASRLLTPER